MPAGQVKCLVIDEAHKAQGNHAYCQVVKELAKHSTNFRVLALSATPGGDIKVHVTVSTLLYATTVDALCDSSHECTSGFIDIHFLFQAVQNVISNLLISHVELRSEDSIDIQPYTHERKVQKVVVPLGQELTDIKTKYLQVRLSFGHPILLVYFYRVTVKSNFTIQTKITYSHNYDL